MKIFHCIFLTWKPSKHRSHSQSQTKNFLKQGGGYLTNFQISKFFLKQGGGVFIEHSTVVLFCVVYFTIHSNLQTVSSLWLCFRNFSCMINMFATRTLSSFIDSEYRLTWVTKRKFTSSAKLLVLFFAVWQKVELSHMSWLNWTKQLATWEMSAQR